MRLLWLLLPAALGNRMQIIPEATLQQIQARAATPAPTPASETGSGDKDVTEGQSLTIPITGWRIGGFFKIKDASDNVVFQLDFAERSGVNKFVRSSPAAQTLEETWGGWPFGPTSNAANLQLTLTKSDWTVKIGTQRYPWFDYRLPSRLVGSNAVKKFEYSGLNISGDAGGVTATAQDCQITCPEFECFCGGGTCKSKQKKAFTSDESCSTGSTGDYCCEGTRSAVLRTNDISEGDVVSMVNKITGDDSYLARTCAAASVTGTCADIQKIQDQPEAKKMRIMSKESASEDGPTGRVVVYIPDAAATLLMWPWSLVKDTETLVTYTYSSSAGMTLPLNPGLSVDASTGYVARVVGNGNSKDWRTEIKNTYIKRVNKNLQFTLERMKNLANGNADYNITVSDVPEITVDPLCFSDFSWRDDTSVGCTKYATEKWCTKTGLRTDAWRQARCGGALCPYPVVNGKSALDACCVCGGGTFDAAAPTPGPGQPTPAPPPAPTPAVDCPECFTGGDGATERVGVQMVFQSSGDYAIFDSSAVKEDLRTAVNTAVNDRINGDVPGQQRYVQFAQGSIRILINVWHTDGRAAELQSALVADEAGIKSAVETELSNAKYSTITSGNNALTTVQQPTQVTIQPGRDILNETLLDWLTSHAVYIGGAGAFVALVLIYVCFVRGGSTEPSRPRELMMMQHTDTVDQPFKENPSQAYAGSSEDYQQNYSAANYGPSGSEQRYQDNDDWQQQDPRSWDKRGDEQDDRDYGEEDDRQEREDRKKTRNQKALARAESNVSNASNVSEVSNADEKGLVPPSRRGRRHQPSPRRR